VSLQQRRPLPAFYERSTGFCHMVCSLVDHLHKNHYCWRQVEKVNLLLTFLVIKRMQQLAMLEDEVFER
jgi:hypothetical protein